MKKARKGFTIVELIIVIGIISILGVMGIMGSSEATAIANATKIVEDFKILGSAMTLYYADNKASCDKAIAGDDGITAKQIIAGMSPYLKDDYAFFTSDDNAAAVKAGTYTVQVGTSDPSQWWLVYGLPEENAKVNKILASKAGQEGLKNAQGNTAYAASGTSVFYRVK